MSNMVSPDSLMKAAKDTMLAGKDPVSQDDWTAVFHFLAANIHPDAQLPALKIIKMIYNAPLSEDDIKAISNAEMAAYRR